MLHTETPKGHFGTYVIYLVVIPCIIHFIWNVTVFSAVNLARRHCLSARLQRLTHGAEFELVIHMPLSQRHVTRVVIRDCKSRAAGCCCAAPRLRGG